MTVYGKRQQTLHDYEGFVEKFKPNKTTDDCYTPDDVYEAVKDWAVAHYGLEGREVVRPFWPGGDFEEYDYPDGCVVIDNQPFSITARVVRFYIANGVDFLLFTPHLTCFNAQANIILCGWNVVYENGARINTSFITNMGTSRVETVSALYAALKALPSQQGAKKEPLPRLAWPDEVLRTTTLDPVIANGGHFAVAAEECQHISGGTLDSGRSVFGGGFYLSRAAAARAAAARAAAARAAAAREAEPVALSAAEYVLIDGLGVTP